MNTTTEITQPTSAELHALWGMIEARAKSGSAECQTVLENWTLYVRAQRERYGKV